MNDNTKESIGFSSKAVATEQAGAVLIRSGCLRLVCNLSETCSTGFQLFSRDNRSPAIPIYRTRFLDNESVGTDDELMERSACYNEARYAASSIFFIHSARSIGRRRGNSSIVSQKQWCCERSVNAFSLSQGVQQSLSLPLSLSLSGKARTSRRPCKAAAPKHPHLHLHLQPLLRGMDLYSQSARTHIPSQPVYIHVLSKYKIRRLATASALTLHLMVLRRIAVSIPLER